MKLYTLKWISETGRKTIIIGPWKMVSKVALCFLENKEGQLLIRILK